MKPQGRIGSFWARFGIFISCAFGLTAGVLLSPHGSGSMVIGFVFGMLAFYLGAWRPFLRQAARDASRARREVAQELADRTERVPLTVEFERIVEDGAVGYRVSVIANGNILTRDLAIQLITDMADNLKRGDEDRLRMVNRTPWQGPDSSLN